MAVDGSARIDFRRRCEHKVGSYFIDVEYPTLAARGNAGAVARMNNTMTERMDQRVDDLRALMAEYELTAPSHFEGELVTVGFEVLAFFADVISLHAALRWYGGGAVGDLFHEPFNFDPRTGDDVPLVALFVTPDAELGGRITDAVRAEVQRRGLDVWTRGSDYDTGLDFGVPENYSLYCLSREGVVLYFRRYQIGPGSTGSPSIVIPYSTWDTLFASDSLVASARRHFAKSVQ
jgi:hypothetical protein